jgi:hypothetical protein
MAARMQKRPPQQDAGQKLSAIPKLSVSQVHSRLEELTGVQLPRRIARAIVEENATKRIPEICNSLSGILRNSGRNSDDTLNLFKRKAFARLLVRSPKELGQVSGYAGEETKQAFLAISGKKASGVFATYPKRMLDAFAQLSVLKFPAKHYAFRILEEHFHEEFARRPKKTAEILAETARILGRRTEALYDTLKLRPFKKAVLSNMGSLVNFADASCYMRTFETIINAKRSGKRLDLQGIMRLMPKLVLVKEVRQGMDLLLMPLMEGIFMQMEASGEPLESLWMQGRELAKKAGITIEDRELCLNFAYAARTIGEKKTLLLNKEFGIGYFARYTKGELESLCKKTGDWVSHGPVFLFAHAKYDSIGAFYSRFPTRKKLSEDNYYDMLFIEAETEDEFYSRIENTGIRQFGISRFQIAGHGTEGRIQLGAGEGEEFFIDLSDTEQLRKLSHLFAEDAMVFLDSCSTGKNEDAIGASISAAWDADLRAPTRPDFPVEYIMDGGKAVGIIYGTGKTAHFKYGLDAMYFSSLPTRVIHSGEQGNNGE